MIDYKINRHKLLIFHSVYIKSYVDIFVEIGEPAQVFCR